VARLQCGEVSRLPRELRAQVRALPIERRRDVIRALRTGTAVNDPRDAPLVVSWARWVQTQKWPRWLLPASRPRGARAVVWLLHAAMTVAALTVAFVYFWRDGGVVRWVALVAFVDTLVTGVWIKRLVLRTRWNAPEAERKNAANVDGRSTLGDVVSPPSRS